MSEPSSSSSAGIGFPGALAVVFITLKLIGVSKVATWSWWWVLSPLWISFAVWLVVLMVAFSIVFWLKD